MNRVLRRGRKMKMIKIKRGSVLVLAVIMVVILLIIGLAMITLGQNARLQAIRSQFIIEAKTAADSGLSHAVNAMNGNYDLYAWHAGLLPAQTDYAIPGADTKFSYPAVTGSQISGWQITSTGAAGPIPTQRTVQATLDIGNPFGQGSLITKLLLDIGNVSSITYTDTSGGTYANAPVRIGSTSSKPVPNQKQNKMTDPVVLGSGEINADVVVGVGGGDNLVTTHNGTKIYGTQSALLTEFEWPDTRATAEFQALNALTIVNTTLSDVNGTKVIGPVDTGKYSSINLIQNGTKLQVSGGAVALYVTGNISMDPATRIEIDNGSSLHIYIDGNFTADPGSEFKNFTNVPALFKIFGTSLGIQTFDLQPNGDLTAAIYAPNADIAFSPQNNGTLLGSCICNSFAASSNFNFTFDKALSAVNPGDPVFFYVKRWTEW